jgi:hypothetical protein
MKNLLLFFSIICLSLLFNHCASSRTERGETSEAVMNDWVLLFDGKTSQGWKGAQSSQFPDSGWVIEDGILMVLAAGGGGDIVTVQQFSEFDLSLEFMLSPGANSGIKYFVQPGTFFGLEYQILDDERHPDAKAGVDGNRTLASLYDLIPAENKMVHPPGEWNHARIVVRGNHIEHWLNGQKVVDFERSTQIFRALVAKSKYREIENFGLYPRGQILLQDHGDKVYFRNIKIRKYKN